MRERRGKMNVKLWEEEREREIKIGKTQRDSLTDIYKVKERHFEKVRSLRTNGEKQEIQNIEMHFHENVI